MKGWKYIAPAVLVWSLLFDLTYAGRIASGHPVSPLPLTLASSMQFRVFDGTYFTNKPDLSVYGIEPLNLVYEGGVFQTSSTDMPPPSALRRLSAECMAAKGITVLDVERWVGLPNAAQLFAGLITALEQFSPGLKLGYYSGIPENDYWRAISGPSSAGYVKWQQENSQLQTVADQVDYLFPSLYTFYNDPKGWVAYAEANIAEARRLAKGKPVYAFLWFDYHNSNPVLGGTQIPPDFWRLELDTVKRLADGVVIWGGGGNWDSNAPWWQETINFLTRLHMAQTNSHLVTPEAPSKARTESRGAWNGNFDISADLQ